MTLDSINWIAVLVATVASFATGFLYFNGKTMFPVWWRAMGRSDSEMPESEGGMALAFGLVTLAALTQALVMTFILRGYAALQELDDVSLLAGSMAGLIVGVGLAATSALGHRLFAGHGVKVWAIETGGDVASLIAIGAVLSFWY
jgi:hypothetical protein